MPEPYRVVVADPPWQFDDKLPGYKRGAERNYRTMPTRWICGMADIHCGELTIAGHVIAKDAVLFLWRVAAMQQDALDVARAWGFKVKTDLVWLKKTSTGQRWFGMGHTLRAEHETCVVCTTGYPTVKNKSTRTTFVTDLDLAGLSDTVVRHSSKPERFYDIVESLLDGPYLELFARRQRPGWTCVGDEAEGAA